MIYNINGNTLNTVLNIYADNLSTAYDVQGNVVYTETQPSVDYTNYSYVRKWASKGITPAQGFDIYDGKVFWVQKNGNDSASANVYIFNLSDGSQSLQSAYVTADVWHGNNLAIVYPLLYATSAYHPSEVYVNTFASDWSATLTYTLIIEDDSWNCDACIDPNDDTILWTLAHTAGSSDLSAPFYISKWDLTDLTDNGDGTYTPALLQTVVTAQPSTSFYFQGCRMHDGILWYASGNGTGSAYIYGVNPNTGTLLYTIDLETTTEPEGLVWVEDVNAVGGYALYVGFQGMMLRKYTFGAI